MNHQKSRNVTLSALRARITMYVWYLKTWHYVTSATCTNSSALDYISHSRICHRLIFNKGIIQTARLLVSMLSVLSFCLYLYVDRMIVFNFSVEINQNCSCPGNVLIFNLIVKREVNHHVSWSILMTPSWIKVFQDNTILWSVFANLVLL